MDSKKRGRKAGGHNTKQKPIIGQPPKQQLFEDKQEEPDYECYSCNYTAKFQFAFCPSCGKSNRWE